MKLTTRLSRSAIDATRFTATSPHAYSKPSPLRSAASSSTPTPTPSSSRPSPQGPQRRSPNGSKPIPPPPAMPPKGATAGETPAEKVARLRAMRLAEREAQVSQWDKVVVRGRTWADRAHKTTVYFLVTFSVVAATITAFALTDMILHNRRKRNAFYAEQRSLYATRLLEAIETEKAGRPLDEDQTLVLNRERAKIMAEEEKKGRGWGWGVWELAFGGLRSEEVGVGQVVVPTEAEVLERIGVDEMEVLEVAEGKGGEGELGGKVERREEGESGLVKAVSEKRREVERRGGEGGPLDRMAERAVEKGMEKGKGGWLGWGR